MPMFAVDQMELIRRLRMTGISVEQIMEAYQTLDRLDVELAPFENEALALNNCSGARYQHTENGIIDTTNPTEMEAVNHEIFKRFFTANIPSKIQSVSTPRSSTNQIDFGEYVDEGQLEEFMGRGIEETCNEIREFVTFHKLAQTRIAAVTGLSQSSVSQFMNQHAATSRVRRILCQWYLAVKHNPTLFGSLQQADSPLVPPSRVSAGSTNSSWTLSKYLENKAMNAQLGNKPKQIRVCKGRFSFNPIHLRMLHKYFSLDPYPDVKKREEIAQACNKAYENTLKGTSGYPFVPHAERVDARIVSNWFNNRRQEKKRQLLPMQQNRRINDIPRRYGFIRRGGKFSNVQIPSSSDLPIEENSDVPGAEMEQQSPTADIGLEQLPSTSSNDQPENDEEFFKL